jgi:hypothetical protein
VTPPHIAPNPLSLTYLSYYKKQLLIHNMNKKSTQVIFAIVIAVVFFGAGWGIKSSSSSSASSAATAARGTYTSTFGGTAGARARTSGGGLVAGKIVSVDPTSISVALPNSTSTSATTGSTVVLYSTGTNILKSVVGSATDLYVGESVTVQGTANSDGSMSATTIQIRPIPAGQ